MDECQATNHCCEASVKGAEGNFTLTPALSLQGRGSKILPPLEGGS